MANRTQRLDEGFLYEVLDYIVEYQKTNGESPTQREIADKFRTNQKRVNRYVHVLAGKGDIGLDDDGAIALPDNIASNDELIPRVGSVRCGNPTLAIEDIDEMFRLPRSFIGVGEFFILTAEGDSMEDVNIFEGDLLVIRRQETADSGDIVVACRISDTSSDEEATLKRYKWTDDGYVLRAENSSGKYKDMDAKKFRIIGKLKCIIRDVE